MILLFEPLQATKKQTEAEKKLARCVNFEIVRNFEEVVDFEDFEDFVYQAGAGTWGIPAASPRKRGG